MYDLRASWKVKLFVFGGSEFGVEVLRFLWFYYLCMCFCGFMCVFVSYFFTVFEFNIVVFVSV